ncbi:MAG: class I SAM-dependent methyltransferase [Geminicoccaceae bacterium]
MGEFATSWLDLREPHDRAARSTEVEARLLEWVEAADCRVIADLGAGTGSNVRALSKRLPGARTWYLLENDPALIAAGNALFAADGSTRAHYVEVDLASDLERAVPAETDLVTCSALLDLVSAEWIARLADLVLARGIALLAVLTHDGRIRWRPGDIHDARIRQLFEQHQRTDKGFGPALGSNATDELVRRLERNGNVATGPSPWRLGEHDREMQRALLAGYREAAREMAPTEEEEIDDWVKQRSRLIDAGRSRLEVGHMDLFYVSG